MNADRIFMALLVTCLVFFGLNPTAFSQDESASAESDIQKVERLYLEGVALYKQNKPREAIARFEEAYALYQDPNLLYNMGRSHELLGELDEALEDFQRCLDSPELTQDLRNKVNGRIVTINAAKSAADKVTAQTPPTRVAPPGNAGGSSSSAQPAPATDSTNMTAVAAWTSGAIAVGLLATGGVFFALGASDHNELDNNINSGAEVAPLTRQDAITLAQSGEDNKTLGVALMGAGAGAGLLSALLFILDGGDDADASALHFSPLPSGGATLTFGGQF